MITSVFLNLIYLLFPLSCYFIYLVYSKAIYEKEKMIFFDLALFSSFYLCSRFGKLPLISCFLINISLLLSIYKKRTIMSIILSVGVSLFLSNAYDVNLFLFIIQYIIILIMCNFSKLKIINVFILCKIIFGILIFLLLSNDIINVKVLGYSFIIWIAMYFVFEFIVFFYDKIETIVKMYNSLEVITKEKKLYESLFKITHEIKNPLAVCKGYLEMFDISNPSKAKKYVGIIDQEIDRTLLLLKDFSNISKLKIEKNLMDINMLLEDVCDEAKLILKNNIDFSNKIPDEGIYVIGDYNRLKQVFFNVIKNAKEAIKENGKIEINAKKIKNKYVITIKDNGVGMDKETNKKIGTAFYTTKKEGTGLGVCFSKEIIEKHNGSIEYFSKLGKGTIVKIILPINSINKNTH